VSAHASEASRKCSVSGFLGIGGRDPMQVISPILLAGALTVLTVPKIARRPILDEFLHVSNAG
jgi:hypothetical protein